jgi:hypothetical protein
MFRERLLELGLISMAIVALATELASAFHLLGTVSAYLTLAAVAAVWRQRWVKPEWSWWAVAPLGLWLVEGLTAILSPPNSSDAMAYHMPRIVYWIQQRSVEFFATPYLNQIMLQPLHEYLVMELQLLTGGDRLANCVAWAATGGYMIAASLVAKALGANTRGQALAAFLVATLPNGILQATGVKNDALLTLLLLSLVYFALERRDWLVGLAVGLACFTKATGILFAAPLVLLVRWRAMPQVAVAVLAINGPFFWRNIDLSGSPLGFDSAHADGRYRWRNEELGWQATVSNLLRHGTEQVGGRSESWNQRVFAWSNRVHAALGLNPQDKGTTWPYTEYAPPRSTSHETDGNNRWHFLLALAALPWLLRQPRSPAARITLAVAAAVVGFCFYLKWQPFMLRMWLPLYALMMAVAAGQLARAPVVAQVLLCALLLDGTRLPLLKNWVRPLRGPETVFNLTREDLYYSDMRAWNVRGDYDRLLAQLKASPCRDIAFDINYFQLEYPVQALLLAQDKKYRFVHVNTENPSRKYEGRMSHIRPCALVCLACDRWFAPLD